MKEFTEGMHKVGEVMAAIISAQVTKQAQEKQVLDVPKDQK